MAEVSPHDVCHQLLHHLRLSNLHFALHETPHSAQIMLRKRFLKDVKHPTADFTFATNPHLKTESDDLKNKNIQLQNINEQLVKEIKELCARNSLSE